MEPPPEVAAKVLCDGMLGTLAKWLRILGIDAAYFGSSGTDEDLIEAARSQGRVIITRDKGVAARNLDIPVLLLSTDDLEKQLRTVLDSLHPEVNPLSRCTVCNVPVVPVPREEAMGRVPPRVYEEHTTFYRCPSCGRFYWWGSHCDDMMKRIKEMGVEDG